MTTPARGARATARHFLAGARDVAPMLIAVGPFGAVSGLAATNSGLSLWEAIWFSALVNAGSSQLASLQLMTSGAPVLVLILSTLFINLRFLMYGLALAPYLEGVRRGTRMLMAHVLVDQTFALGLRRFGERKGETGRVPYYFGVGVPLLVVWVGGTAVGGAFGAAVPPEWALEFTIPLIFLSMLMPAIRDRPGAIAAVVGAGLAVLLAPLPYGLGLILGALIGIAAGLLSERWMAR